MVLSDATPRTMGPIATTALVIGVLTDVVGDLAQTVSMQSLISRRGIQICRALGPFFKKVLPHYNLKLPLRTMNFLEYQNETVKKG